MVSVLDSGLRGPGSSTGWGSVLYSWARHFTLIVPLSTQVYKWVLGNLLLGVTLRWTSIPFRGSRNTPSRYGNQDKLQPDGPLGLYVDFTYQYKTGYMSMNFECSLLPVAGQSNRGLSKKD